MLSLILHNIRSAHNVGSIFRTADAAGISRIYLCGYTPAPIDQFKRGRKDISKVSLGAEKNVSWEQREDTLILISELKEKGFQIIALEQDERSVDYKKIKIEEKSVLILGEEVKGISKEILDVSDCIAEIPMKGEKESLNVSVAAGIAIFQMLGI